MADWASILESNKEVTLDGHWLWAGNLVRGYGSYGSGNNRVGVHRISAHIYLGLNLKDSSIRVCHKDDICRYTNCFNPEHLYLGDARTNTRDSVKFGTHVSGFAVAKSKNCNKLGEPCKVCGVPMISYGGRVRCRPCTITKNRKIG